MNARVTLSSFALLGACAFGCAVADGDPVDAEEAPFPSESPRSEEVGDAILALLNDPSVGEDELDFDARLNAQAAYYLMQHRNGPDDLAGTEDDDLFDSLHEVDRVKYVGPVALERLSAYAVAQGYAGPDTTDSDTL